MMKIFLVVSALIIMLGFNIMLMFYINLLFFISILLLLYYMMSNGDYMIMISGYFGVDKYSIYMILLSVWVVGLMYMSLGYEADDYIINKIFVFGLVLFVLISFFSTMNLLMMYLFFEISLIPTFFIVLYWGNNWERLEASFYLLMYMMFISLPLLIYIMILGASCSSLDMNLMSYLDKDLGFILGKWDFLILFGAFFIKLPVFLFHIWLPKAHVEAPVYGSMLLAAILLKLGGYGLIRLSLMFIESCVYYSEFVISLGFMGAFYVSMYCLVQVDMKMMVAYSSVVHMNFMMASLFSLLKIGFISSIVVMISHGLCSSGLFYMVNMYYLRSHSRLLMMNKGYINFMAVIMMWWFFLCSSNFSFPFSLNFIGEIMMIMVFLSWGIVLIMLIGLICFFSSVYSLYLFSMVSHGEGYSMNKSSLDSGQFIEHLSLMLHYLPLLIYMMNFYICMW